jgi:hypothetical protein
VNTSGISKGKGREVKGKMQNKARNSNSYMD